MNLAITTHDCKAVPLLNIANTMVKAKEDIGKPIGLTCHFSAHKSAYNISPYLLCITLSHMVFLISPQCQILPQAVHVQFPGQVWF